MFNAGSRAIAVLTAVVLATTGLSTSVSAAGQQLAALQPQQARPLDYSKLPEQERYGLAALAEEVGFKEIHPAAGILAEGCGSACDFKNPQTYYIYWCGPGCEDNLRCSDGAQTKAVVGGIVELRYSPTCRTVWARWGSLAAGVTPMIISYYSGWNERTRSAGPADSFSNWTLMLNDKNLCGRAAYSYGPLTEYTDLCY